ncbi:hypothetical protein GCM10023322_07250 [Rugosimonospora acidiphila]|uniref:OmpR/PhoB-type domain-containing protein n=1 Tax=Rugosimonospora acidiphila TaxID=556531 RepID=A0ABP9RL47_9ACTN
MPTATSAAPATSDGAQAPGPAGPSPHRAGDARYRILGPLEIRLGDHWLPVRQPKWRSLLATLLVEANRVVPVTRLVAQLWGERPPPSAAKLVQLYAGRLRRTLHDPDGARLVTRSPGYQLRTVSGELDRDVFDDHLRAGERALDAGDAEQSLRRLDAALSLWSGPAFGDISGVPVVDAERMRLEELRLSAMETRVDALLACQRYLAVLPDLTALVVDHPLRERLRGQLMLALYGAGRQADALATYRDLQRRLDTELGIQPAPSVQRLHLAILRADPTLEHHGLHWTASGPPAW